MTIGNLQEFLCLAEVENFQIAADMLYISQSTLSRHIMTLEKELGNVELFSRVATKTRLTESGMKFFPYARQAIEIWENCQADLEKLREQANDTITVAIIQNMNPYHLTLLLGSFIRQFPNIRINIIECNSKTFQNILEEEKCDFAFVQELEKKKGDSYSRIKYTTDTVIAMLPLNHPLAGQSEVTIEELKNEKFVSTSPNELEYQCTLEICRKAEITPNLIYSGLSGRNLTGLVEQGVGVALLLRKQATYINNNVAAILDLAPQFTININFLYHKKMMTESGKCFYQYVRTFITQHKNILENCK